jgi:hypothetical protein
MTMKTTPTCPRSIDSAMASVISYLSGDSGQQEIYLFASFRNDSLHGRLEEQNLLQDAYERIRTKPGSASELFVIHGDGGAGKTCLVESMRTKVTDQEGFFVSGTFDQIHKSIPFSAISEALSDLCDLVLQERVFEAEDCLTAGAEFDIKLHPSLLLEKVGREAASVLTRLVNNFAPLVGLAETDDEEQHPPRTASGCVRFDF